MHFEKLALSDRDVEEGIVLENAECVHRKELRSKELNKEDTSRIPLSQDGNRDSVVHVRNILPTSHDSFTLPSVVPLLGLLAQLVHATLFIKLYVIEFQEQNST